VVKNDPEKRFKAGGFASLFGQLFAFAYFLTISILWVFLDSYMLSNYPHRFMLTLGFVNAYLLARIIVQRVTKEHIQHFHFIFVPFTIVFLVTVIGSRTYERKLNNHYINMGLLVGLLAVNFIQWLFFFSTVTRQLSKHLKIPVFTVDKERMNQPATENSALLNQDQGASERKRQGEGEDIQQEDKTGSANV